MKSFLKTFLACFFAIGFIFFILFVVLARGAFSKEEKSPKIEANSILNLTLKGELTDRSYNNPFRNMSAMSALSGSFSQDPTIGLTELKRVLEYAKTDDYIKGIFLNIDNLEGQPASIFDLRNALENFKKSNKFIYAYSSATPELNLMLCTVANKFYMNPLGECEFDGFAMQMDYVKGLMDKLGVEYKVFYVGEYKSATEMFRRTGMSPEDRLQRTELLNDISNDYLENIHQSTNVSVDSLKQIQNNLLVMDASEAVKYGFASGLKYEDEVINEIKEKLGYKSNSELKLISYKNYKEIVKIKNIKTNDNKIAVIYAEGEINDSKSDDGVIGGEAYVKLIQKLSKDDAVKGIVLRVNSPGGSAFASEQIYHALKMFKTKKPIVVSMGNYAASGGYYIASIADKIIAQPNTITGSIGIFGMIPNIRKALNEKVGVTFDEVKTATHANFFNLVNDWDELETSKVQKHVENGYNIFLNRVAFGRKMDTAAVNKIARGRVWTGQDALKIGLVDELGGLETAIKEIKILTKLQKAEIVEYPKNKTITESILEDLMGNKDDANAKMLKNLTPQLLFTKQLDYIQSLGIYQYRLPYGISVR
jgi:protease-4